MGNASKSRLARTIMVIVLAIVALIAALLVVPPLALKAGLFEQHIGYATAAAAFLIVFVAARWIKALNRKSADETKTRPRKR